MDITVRDIIDYIIKNGTNGRLTINEVGTEIVINSEGKEEKHDFLYSEIFIQRLDKTERIQELEQERKLLG